MWEAQDAQGMFFGQDRLKQILRERAAADAKTIVMAVIDEVSAFQSDAGRSDDCTCVVEKFTG